MEALRRGVELNIFRLGDYQIPYGYAPVLVATEHTIRCKPPSASLSIPC